MLVRQLSPILWSCNVNPVEIDLAKEVLSVLSTANKKVHTNSGPLGAPIIDLNVPSPMTNLKYKDDSSPTLVSVDRSHC
jgi:hypothetical protein